MTTKALKAEIERLRRLHIALSKHVGAVGVLVQIFGDNPLAPCVVVTAPTMDEKAISAELVSIFAHYYRALAICGASVAAHDITVKSVVEMAGKLRDGE